MSQTHSIRAEYSIKIKSVKKKKKSKFYVALKTEIEIVSQSLP